MHTFGTVMSLAGKSASILTNLLLTHTLGIFPLFTYQKGGTGAQYHLPEYKRLDETEVNLEDAVPFPQKNILT